jgi:hypothetical protein
VRDELLLADDAIFDSSRSSNGRSDPVNDGLAKHRCNNKLTALTGDVTA